MELQRRIAEYAQRHGQVAEDELFYIEQNARLVKNTEEYYCSMFRGHMLSWNIRDRHMAETLDHVTAHLERQGNRSKVVVWAHNSHLGYAPATDMGIAGELNVGQLVRDKYDDYDAKFSDFSGVELVRRSICLSISESAFLVSSQCQT